MTLFDGVLFANTVTQTHASLGVLDWVTLIAYFVVLLGIAWYVILKKTDTSQEYFLAGRKTGWFVIGASLFASNIGSEHLVGLAGTGASDGMAMAHYELHAWCLLVLGWIMVPFYERSCVFTMPEFLERRYSVSARWFLSVMSLVACVMTSISVTLYAGGIVFKALFPNELIAGIDNFWFGAVGMVLITGIYTILGGLRAVLYTEVMQIGVLLIGSACVLFIGLNQVGGWNELKNTIQGKDLIGGYKIEIGKHKITGKPIYLTEEIENPSTGKTEEYDIIIKRPKAIGDKRKEASLSVDELTKDDIVNSDLEERLGKEKYGEIFANAKHKETDLASILPEEERRKADHFNIWKPNSDPHYPWFGLLFGAPIVGLWYWCTNQFIVQRTLSARNQQQGRRGTIFGAYLKLTPVFIFIVPGMIAYGLALQGKIGAEVLQSPDQAFPILVKEVLPVGLKGLVVGGLLAALMSSLASVFNACSTLFTIDIYQKLHPKASEATLVWVGRLSTAGMVLLGIAWIPIIQYMPRSLYDYLQSVQAYIAPSVFAVFFLGIFFTRINAYGCMAGLIVGFFLGMMRLALEITYNMGWAPHLFPAGGLLTMFTKTNFTFVCIFLTVLCSILVIGVSLLTPKPHWKQLEGLTFATSTEAQKKETRDSWSVLDVVFSAGLVAIIIGIYIYFSPTGGVR